MTTAIQSGDTLSQIREGGFLDAELGEPPGPTFPTAPRDVAILGGVFVLVVIIVAITIVIVKRQRVKK